MQKHITKNYITHFIIFLLSALAIFQFYYLNKLKNERSQFSNWEINDSKQVSECLYSIERNKSYRFVEPVLKIREECESKNYLPIKSVLGQLIDSFKREGLLTSAAIYLQDFKQNGWINLNESERFDPGSLFKLPMVITYLRMNEVSPGFLDHELLYDQPYNFNKKQVFPSRSIKLGKSYSYRQLLYQAIAYSDNEAYALLCKNVDVAVYQSTFTDLGLSAPDPKATTYPITAKDYSAFMNVLFDASYLTIKDSEYASELLSNCDFVGGMRQSLPDSVMLIHKFGESGDINLKEFHESGIIYLHNFPYLLTIMTKGKDMEKLPDVVRLLSNMIYEDMTRQHS